MVLVLIYKKEKNLQSRSMSLFISMPNCWKKLWGGGNSATDLHCIKTVLLHCSTVTLQYSSTAVLLYCSTAVLLYSSTAVLLYCSTAVLCSTAVQ